MVMIISEKHCFYPDAFEYLTPDRWDLDYEIWRIAGPEGHLTGWHIPPAGGTLLKKVTVLHLHGNAQNMSAHLLGSYFLAQEGFRLITFDYRGYGRSQGRPTLAGIIADGRAAVRHLLDDPPGPGERLALFGQPMGAFTAAHLLPFFPDLDRVVLEAGLVSFRDLFLEVYPEADVQVPDGYSTLDPLGRSPMPKLFIHGTADTVVPVSHSRRMYEAAAEPKELLILPGVGHIDALSTSKAKEYRDRVVGFLSGNPQG